MTEVSNRLKVLLAAFLLFAAIFSYGSGLCAESPRVLHAEIRGTINPASAEYFSNAISRADAEHAAALVVSLDTPGGLISSVEKMAQAIDRAKTPVIVYVEPAGASATSAGALLLLASHVSAMTPGSHMGSAHPVDSSGKDIAGAMGEKVLNDTSAFAEGMAEIHGRDKKLAADIVRKSRSFTAKEAFDSHLADVLADSLPDLLRRIDGRKVTFRPDGSHPAESAVLQTANAQVSEFEMTIGQKILNALSNPNIAAILATLGLVLLYFELNHPGIQVAGIFGVVSLVVSFMAFQSLPIRAGGVILLVVGGIGLVAEVFAATHGVLGAAGVVSFMLGLVWVIDPEQTRQAVSPAVYIPAALFLGAMALLVGWFAARVKRENAVELLRLKGGSSGGLSGYVGVVDSLIHETSGKIIIRGELWDFTSIVPVCRGDTVEVVTVEGLRVHVQPNRKSAPGLNPEQGE
ncbi:MAG: nodulation protein NfeD [Cryobacterium sp.]|nr:nodulation protein NfeD [Oligoflexia bacterium]